MFLIFKNKLIKVQFLILFSISNIIFSNSIFFDLLAICKLENLKLPNLNFINSYNVIFANSLNFITLIIAIVVSLFLIFFLLAQANLLNISFYPNATFDAEKYSPYECGFAPFRTEWAQFDIKFYLVALLFLVFDVELMFLLPYCLSYHYLNFYGYLVFLLFFTILVIGFLIEWSIGMLVWKDSNTILKKNTFKSKNSIKFQLKQKYLNYLIDYFLILEIFSLWKIINWERNYSTFSNLKRKNFKMLKKERFFENEISSSSDIQKNKKKIPVFFGVEDFYVGSSAISSLAVETHIKRKTLNLWVEKFFTSLYGDRYKQWLDTLEPHERNFVF